MHFWQCHELQMAMNEGSEAKLVLLNFSIAFDCLNHDGILIKLGFMRVESSVLSITNQFLRSWTHGCIDGDFSRIFYVHSGVSQRNMFGLLLLYSICNLFMVIENRCFDMQIMLIPWLLFLILVWITAWIIEQRSIYSFYVVLRGRYLVTFSENWKHNYHFLTPKYLSMTLCFWMVSRNVLRRWQFLPSFFNEIKI